MKEPFDSLDRVIDTRAKILWAVKRPTIFFGYMYRLKLADSDAETVSDYNVGE